MRRERLSLALLAIFSAFILCGCGESKPPLVPDPDPPAASSDGGAAAPAAPGSTAGTTAP